MRGRISLTVGAVAALLGCSASHADDVVAPEDRPGPETSPCEGGAFLGELQLHNPPSYGATATGDIWFDSGSEIAIVSPDFTTTTPLADDPYGVAVSPEGDRLAFRRDGELVVRELASGAEMSAPAPFRHAFGFVDSVMGPSRAWSCADGTLTLFAEEPIVVAPYVDNCHDVHSVGRVLYFRDAERRFEWLLDGEGAPHRLSVSDDSASRTGVLKASRDGRWIFHQPALACPSGETTCTFEGAGYVEVYDAETGVRVPDVDLGPTRAQARFTEAEGAMAIQASDGPLTLVSSDGTTRTIIEGDYRPLAGLEGGRFLVRGVDRSVHVIAANGTARPVVDRAIERDARFEVSADGSHFVVAYPTGACFDADDFGCRVREWRVVIESAEGGARAEWLGRGLPNLVTITDAGLALVIDFEDLDSPEAASHYRNRVLDPNGRELLDEWGPISAFLADGERLFVGLAEEGIRVVSPSGTVASMPELADGFAVDTATDRLLRLRAFPDREATPADYGPPARFCVFATPLTTPGS